MIQESEGISKPQSEFASVAGYRLERIDAFLGKLGNPVGIHSYKPYHSNGEDFLQNYMGMIGIPMELTPAFPSMDQKMIFLTEHASFDTKLVEKIKKRLIGGNDVMITSSLYRRLTGQGIEGIVELEYTDKKASVHQFYDWQDVYTSEKDILIPQIRYATNDSWELITALDSGIGYPILQQASYGNAKLYVLVIPDNFGELYEIPKEILTKIKQVMMKSLFVYTDSPSHVSLFVYDNNTFIVESFKEYPVPVKIVLYKKFTGVTDLESNQAMDMREENDKSIFTTRFEPHTYKVYQAH